MIAHVVLFQPPDGLTSEARRELLATIASAVDACPTVRGCRVGKRVLHRLPGYEQAMRQDYRYALMLEFDDVQGLRDYLVHPAHVRLGALFDAASSSLAYDYELFDLGGAQLAL